MTSRLVALCFSANDPGRLARFWRTALRWELGNETTDEVRIVPTDETSFEIVFRPVDGPKAGRNRIHLDLTTESLEDQRDSVATLLELGARHLDIGQGPDEEHVVLADPEGNELCLIEPTNRFLADAPRIGALSCDGSRAVGLFWRDALRWPLVWDQGEETAVRSPDGTGPFITWGGGPELPKHGRSRLYLEIAADGGTDHETELERLVALGASRADPAEDPAGAVLLRDPDGNEVLLASR